MNHVKGKKRKFIGDDSGSSQKEYVYHIVAQDTGFPDRWANLVGPMATKEAGDPIIDRVRHTTADHYDRASFPGLVNFYTAKYPKGKLPPGKLNEHFPQVIIGYEPRPPKDDTIQSAIEGLQALLVVSEKTERKPIRQAIEGLRALQSLETP